MRMTLSLSCCKSAAEPRRMVNPDTKLLTIGAVVVSVLALAIVPLIAIPALVVLWLLYALSGA
jgi:hypothetical protein